MMWFFTMLVVGNTAIGLLAIVLCYRVLFLLRARAAILRRLNDELRVAGQQLAEWRREELRWQATVRRFIHHN